MKVRVKFILLQNKLQKKLKDETFKDMMPETTTNKDATLEVVKEIIWKFNHQITDQSLMAETR